MTGITGVMPYGYGSCGSDLASLNGLAGTNSYGGYSTGFMGGYYGSNTTAADVEGVKQNIANQYDIYATQQSYQGRQAIENSSLSERAKNIADMLHSGRSNDAAKQFDIMIGEIKAMPQYANLTDKELEAVLKTTYRQSTGMDLAQDISANAKGSFAQGLVDGTIVGLLADGTSADNLREKVSGIPVRGRDVAARAVGGAISGTATLAVGTAATVGVAAIAGKTIGAGLLAATAQAGTAAFLGVTPLGWGILAAGALIGVGAAIYKSLASK